MATNKYIPPLPELIKKTLFQGDTMNQITLSFTTGKFDNYRVTITDYFGAKDYPLDADYFREYKKLVEADSNKTKQQGYNDFVIVAHLVERTITRDSELPYDEIKKVADTFEDEKGALKWLIVLYMAMVAEENRIYEEGNTYLGKLPKMLGMYQLLIENQKMSYVVNYSKGKPHELIQAECDRLGIKRFAD